MYLSQWDATPACSVVLQVRINLFLIACLCLPQNDDFTLLNIVESILNEKKQHFDQSPFKVLYSEDSKY